MVQLCDGTSKPIEEVEVGDWVKSKDDETGELSCQRVTQTHTRSASQVYEIVVESEVGQELLLASAEHPFFVEGQLEPKLTQQLLPGDRLISYDGNALWIRQIRLVPRSQQVFNLTVENKHTYFAGWHGVWNHNEDCDTSFAPTSTPGTFPKANDFSSPKQLKTHWKKHVEKNNEWGSKMTQEQYLARAKKFLSGPRGKDVLEYRRFNGHTVRYNTRTGEYGVVGADGTINTFFRSAMSKRGGDALQYFQEDRMKHIGR